MNPIKQTNTFISPGNIQIYTESQSFTQNLKHFINFAEIEEFNIELDKDGHEFVIYRIKVHSNSIVYHVFKRYQQFLEFYNKLKVTIGKSSSKAFLFPKKSYLNKLSPDFLRKRQSHLNRFLNNIFKAIHLLPIKEIDEFFELETNLLELSQNLVNGFDQESQIFKSVHDFLNNYYNLTTSEIKEKYDFLMNKILNTRLNENLINKFFHSEDSNKNLLIIALGSRYNFNSEKHVACSQKIKFIIDILQKSGVNQVNLKNSFKNVRPNQLIKYKIDSHLSNKVNSECQIMSFTLIGIYSELNHKDECLMFFRSYKDHKAFKNWLNRSSTKLKIEDKFPTFIEFMSENILNQTLFKQISNLYCDINNISILKVDEKRQISSLCSLINKSQSEIFEQCINEKRFLNSHFDQIKITGDNRIICFKKNKNYFQVFRFYFYKFEIEESIFFVLFPFQNNQVLTGSEYYDILFKEKDKTDKEIKIEEEVGNLYLFEFEPIKSSSKLILKTLIKNYSIQIQSSEYLATTITDIQNFFNNYQ